MTGSARGQLASASRLILLVAALLLAYRAYTGHLGMGPHPQRWLVELLLAAIAASAALGGSSGGERPLRRRARWLAGIVCLLSAATALHLIPRPGAEVAAAASSAAAVAAFFLARWVPFRRSDVEQLIGPAGAGLGRRGLRAASIVLAPAAGSAAAYLNSTRHLAGFVLWITSLLLFLVALWPGQAQGARDAADRWQDEAGPRIGRRAELGALLVIIALAAALRVLVLADFPARIDPDEGRQGRYAERIWQEGFPDAFDIGWNSFPHLSYMAEYVWVQARGTSNAHLRLAAASVGILSLLPVYFWVRRWWGNVVALIATALLAVNHEHLYWSRIALNNIHQVLIAGLVLCAFARVLRTNRLADWALLGIAMGLGFHTYHAAKLYPALLALCGALLVLGVPSLWRRCLPGAVAGAIAFILCVGPHWVTIHHKWEAYYRDTSNRVDLYELRDAWRAGEIGRVRSYVYTHVGGCLLSFTSVPHVRDAFLDRYVAVPFLVGIAWVLWCWRDPRHLVLVVWLGGILVIGGMITSYPPWKPRLIGFLPVLCVVAALVAGKLRAALWSLAGTRADLIAIPLFVLWLSGSLYESWYSEFSWRPDLERGEIMTSICRAIRDMRLPGTVYMAGGDVMAEPRVAVHDCMIAAEPTRRLVNLPNDAQIAPLPADHTGDALFLLGPTQRDLAALVTHYYPEARGEVVYDAHGNFVLAVYTLDAASAERKRGLLATMRDAGGVRVGSATPEALQGLPDAPYPIEARWSGLLQIRQPGTYVIRCTGARSLTLGGRRADAEGSFALAAGWHALDLEATLNRPEDRLVLEWRTPDAAEVAPIPRALLHAHGEGHGLLGRYFTRVIDISGPAPIDAAADYEQIEEVLSFEWLRELEERPPDAFAARPSTMEWIGAVELPQLPAQLLRLQVSTPTEVYLDGQLVLRAPGNPQASPVEAAVPAVRGGAVPLLVRSVRRASDDPFNWRLRLSWRSPGGEWTSVMRYHPPEKNLGAIEDRPDPSPPAGPGSSGQAAGPRG